MNFFKDDLLVGSDFLNAQSVAFTSIEDLADGLKIPMMMFWMSYPYSDKTNYDIRQQWVTQTIKA